MLSRMDWFTHAFATDPPGPAQPTDRQRALIERLCHEVVRRRMTAPAHLLLEMGRPLNYVSAQLMVFFQPFLTAITDASAYDELTAFLEQRGSLEYIEGRLEAIEGTAATPSGPAAP